MRPSAVGAWGGVNGRAIIRARTPRDRRCKRTKNDRASPSSSARWRRSRRSASAWSRSMTSNSRRSSCRNGCARRCSKRAASAAAKDAAASCSTSASSCATSTRSRSARVSTRGTGSRPRPPPPITTPSAGANACLTRTDALTEFARECPAADLQQLRACVREARKDRLAGRASRHYRDLFRLVRAALEARSPTYNPAP